MPELRIEQPGLPPMTVAFTGPEMSFGRAANNEVVLMADEVSRHHAKLCQRGKKVALVDLKSLNGTFVNRQRVVERMLADEDEIWLGGKCRITYHDAPESEGAPPPPKAARGSTLQADLERIRDKMDRAASNLTLMGTHVDPSAPAASVQASPEELLDMSRAYRRLEALYEATKEIASEFDLAKRIESVLDIVLRVLNADRGFVLMREKGTEDLRVSVVRGLREELQAGAPSMGIARRAAIDGEPVLVTDAESDSRFSMRESIIVQNIVSAMCVPMRVEDRLLGSIYVDSRRAMGAFNEADLELFVSLASQLAMAIENVRLYEQMLAVERKRANLGRFLSPAVVDVIMNEESTLELGGRKRVVTSLFCDIRGFTPLTERLGAAQIVDLLNEHFTAMTEIVFNHRGTLDKYIGDEIMAVFGAPLSAHDDAERAVRAALAIQNRNAELNAERAGKGRPEIQVGIGIDTGEVIAGFIGSPMRMDFTVVGDRVNTARRLCDVALPGQVIIGEPTYELVKDVVVASPLGPVALEGKKLPAHVFLVENIRT